ncbi:response regulator [Geomesophilobacter sediminis]|nr:response regulator [Geomesophilobacter sediminis]
MQRKRVGEILVEKGILTVKTVDRMVEISKQRHKRIGVVLEDFGLINSEELAEVLATQHGCRVINNFAQHNFPPELLALISADVAMQNQIFPLKLEGNRLALAMADPAENRIVKNLAVNRGLSIIPFVATTTEIYEAICRSYLQKEITQSEAPTVLVAQEDRLVRTMLSDVLGKSGFRVVAAIDGLEAYKTVLIERPQVIVTDLFLPKLDGYGLFDSLQSVPELKRIPVILVADSMHPQDEEKAFERGFFDFITKPLRESTVISRTRRALLFYDRKYMI